MIDRLGIGTPRVVICALFLALLVASGLAVGCASGSPDEPGPPRLVLLYLPCSVNRGFLGPYNPEVAYTPHLNHWAERGVVLSRHQTEAGQSGISYASLLTGARTDHHGIYTNGFKLRDSLELVSESLGAAGYDVYAWLRHAIGAQYNYGQGVPEENLTSESLEPTDPPFRAILRRLREDPSYRALVITNFTVTHGPYRTQYLDEYCALFPDECAALEDRERFDELYTMYSARENYRGLSWDFPNTVERLELAGKPLEELAAVLELAYKSSIWHLDGLFGELVGAIDEAGLIDESLIVFTVDHGEILYRDNAHFKWAHGLQLAPEVITTPAIFVAPGHLPPGTYEGVTRAIDIFPTVAGLTGAEAPRGPRFGRDLSTYLRGEKPPADLLAFSHSTIVHDQIRSPNDHYKHSMFHGMDPRFLWVGVRSGDRFYKRLSLDGENFHTEAFDLAVDPEERNDLFDPDDPTDARMEELLIDYREELIRTWHEHRRPQTDEELERQLATQRALGYIE